MARIITPRMGTFYEAELGGVESGGCVECGAMTKYKKVQTTNEQNVIVQKEKSQPIVEKT